jgi:hypothetical protein
MNEKNEELYALPPYIMNQEFYIIGLKESQKGSEYSPRNCCKTISV